MVKETEATKTWLRFTNMAARGYLMEAASQASNIKGESIKSEKPGERNIVHK